MFFPFLPPFSHGKFPCAVDHAPWHEGVQLGRPIREIPCHITKRDGRNQARQPLYLTTDQKVGDSSSSGRASEALAMRRRLPSSVTSGRPHPPASKTKIPDGAGSPSSGSSVTATLGNSPRVTPTKSSTGASAAANVPPDTGPDPPMNHNS